MTNNLFVARQAIYSRPEKVIIFTGAGVSAESGIRPFRNSDESLWDEFDVETFSSIDGFLEQPLAVWRWYLQQVSSAKHALPNAAHLAIASVQYPVITQNVDLLHEAAGSKNVLHMHGQGDRAKCTECLWEGELTELDITVVDVPPGCPECGSLARPDIVWFGEPLSEHNMLQAYLLLKDSICVVIGTSGRVEPVAHLPGLANLVISINSCEDDHVVNSLQLTGTASDILPRLFAE